MRWGNAKFAWIAEYSSTSINAPDISSFNRIRSVVGLEYKLGNDMYLTLGVARDTGLDAAKQTALAKINWGFGGSPTLNFAAK